MEKILPHPILPRFFDSPQDEKRYADRMMVRGIRVVSDEDPEDGPKWRGDHSFSADAARYSLTNFIEPEVAKSHPSWTREQVRSHARETFEKRLHQDLAYEKKESSHEESSVTWQPIQTEKGWELATVYGDTMITLSELWEHTKEFAAFAGNPAAYNAEEHATQLRMQDAFICGEATGFVSVLSHPDAVRYVQVWKKTDDGSIVSTHIDLAKTTGRDFTHEESAAFIHHLQSVHGGDAAPESTYAHFFVRGENVSEHDIRAVAISRTIEVNHARIPRERENVGDTVLRDTFDSMAVIGAYLRDHIERRISDFKEHAQKIRKPPDEHPIPVIEKQLTFMTQRIKRDAQEPVKSLLANWWVTKGILHHVDRVPVAAVPALSWITQDVDAPAVELEGVKRFSTIRYVEKKEKMTDINTLGIKKFSERARELIVKSTKKLVSLMTFKKTPFTTESRIRKVESSLPRVVPARDVLSRIIARVRIPHWIDALSARRIQQGENARLSRLIDATTRWFQRIAHHEYLSGNRPSQGKTELRELLVPLELPLLRFAFLFWRAIHASNVEVGSNNVIKEHPSSDRGVPTETIPPHWVLLSIIWYLALLREGGFAKKKHKKKKRRSLLWHHISLHFVIE